MNRYDPASAGYAHTAFGGTQEEGNALIGGPERDVVLTLSHDQFTGMRDQAREVMDKKLAEYQAAIMSGRPGAFAAGP
jgi:hypothetical protein